MPVGGPARQGHPESLARLIALRLVEGGDRIGVAGEVRQLRKMSTSAPASINQATTSTYPFTAAASSASPSTWGSVAARPPRAVRFQMSSEPGLSAPPSKKDCTRSSRPSPATIGRSARTPRSWSMWATSRCPWCSTVWQSVPNMPLTERLVKIGVSGWRLPARPPKLGPRAGRLWYPWAGAQSPFTGRSSWAQKSGSASRRCS